MFWAWTEMWEISVCSSVSSGCVLPWRVTGGSEPFGYLWMPTSGRCDPASRPSGVSDVMEMGSACSRPLRTDCQSNHASLDSYRTKRSPCYGRGCRVRLVVDSTLPLGGSVWSWWETAFLLRRLRLGEAEEGFHSFGGPLAGSTSSTVGDALDSETQESAIHFGLQPYGRVSGGSLPSGLYSGGYSYTTSAECLNL
jgi:hypothetical protein